MCMLPRLRSSSQVAIKVLAAAAKPSEAEIASFVAEGQLLQHLAHDHVLRVYGICVENTDAASTEPLRVAIVMELAATSLYKRVVQAGAACPLSLRERVRILLEAALGVAYLHGLYPPVIHGECSHPHTHPPTLHHRISPPTMAPMSPSVSQATSSR